MDEGADHDDRYDEADDEADRDRPNPTPLAPAISVSRCFTSSSVVAPSIVGMARKKLNSAAVRRSTPRRGRP